LRKITPVRTKRLIKLCTRLGWKKDRIKGDHLALAKSGKPRPIILKLSRTSPPWLILQVMKNLGVTRNEYFKLMRKIK